MSDKSPLDVALAHINDALKSGQVKLDLSGLGLQEIPPEIGRLSHLKELLLENNLIKVLSDEIFQIEDLEILDLSNNPGLYALPPDIKSFIKLISLDLSNCYSLYALPQEIGELYTLKMLKIHQSALYSLPRKIGQLKALIELQISGSQLDNIPREIGNLSNLVSLNLRANNLRNLPSIISNLSHLEQIDLSNNLFVSIPESIMALTGVRFLKLAGNPIKSIPDEILESTTDVDTLLSYLDVGELRKVQGKRIDKKEFEKTQDNLSIPNKEYERSVFISYKWEDESERLVDQLEDILIQNNIEVVRDKKDLGYRESIKKFEKRIGQGRCVILVISDGYLRSEHCMYELLCVDENKNLRKRVLPLILESAHIYKPINCIEYMTYWGEEKNELDGAIRDTENLEYTIPHIATLEKYSRIYSNFNRLLETLVDMNAKSVAEHRQNNFKEIIRTIKAMLGLA